MPRGEALSDSDRAIASAQEPAVVEPETEKVLELLGLREAASALV